jgi:hypothetical protein
MITSDLDSFTVPSDFQPELTSFPGYIREMQHDIGEALDWELYAKSLISFLDTDTLRSFTEQLRDEADIEDLLIFDPPIPSF